MLYLRHMENWTSDPIKNATDNNDAPFMLKRHGCVTAWLIFGMVINAIVGLGYILMRDLLPQAMMEFSQNRMELTPNYFLTEGLVSLALVFCFVQLWQWKKMGFHGIILCTMITASVNYMANHQLTDFIFSFTGVLVHFLVLQIKINNQSAWSLLR